MQKLDAEAELSADDLHIGKYHVYRTGDEFKALAAGQSMTRDTDGTLTYEHQGFRIIDARARRVRSDHQSGIDATVEPSGDIVWDNGYTSMPATDANMAETTRLAGARDIAVAKEVLKCLRAVPDSATEIRQQFRAWSSAKPEDLSMERNSGMGGGTTIKVSLKADAEAAAVCVHLYGATFGGATPVDDLFKTRLRKAHGVFAAAGLATARLGEWEHDFIEPWLPGGSLGSTNGQDWARFLSEDNCEAVGALLAGVHSVDKAWFDEVREEVMQRYPQLQEAGIGADSYLWKDAGLLAPTTLGAWLDKPTLELFEKCGAHIDHLCHELAPLP